MTDERSGTTREPGQRALHQVVGRLARTIDHELPGGTVAALRKLAPGEVGGGAFWRVLGDCLEDGLPQGDGEARSAAERRWAAVLCGMAITAGLNAGPQAGSALASAGLSEHRFDRLLRASGARLHDEVRTAARLLASKGTPLDWTDLARLVLTDESEGSEPARRSLARSYYRTIHSIETT